MGRTPEELMAYTIELSRIGMRDKGWSPFAAIIVKDGEIVGEGCNDTTDSHDPTAHGEVLAIRDATSKLGTADLSGCEIYTSCEPCALCVAAIWWAKLDKVYYANTLEDCAALGVDCYPLVEHISRPIGERDIPEERLLGPEAHAVLKDWVPADFVRR
ncbi:MAG: nucleoside deaminase [Pseudomonadota bacterium]